MLRGFQIVLALALGLGVLAPVTQAETVADLVMASGGEPDADQMDHDLLLRGLHKAGLLGLLRDVGDDEEKVEFTLWAPNDRAFVIFARDLGYTGGYDEKAIWEFLQETLGGGGLSRLLRYHVTKERITPFQFYLRSTSRTPIKTLHGRSVQPDFFHLRDGARRSRDPHLVFPVHVHAENGIIRSLDRVLLPQDLPR
jgi:uncharacterized surface protein with fasciclin (FAS1) repeats